MDRNPSVFRIAQEFAGKADRDDRENHKNRSGCAPSSDQYREMASAIRALVPELQFPEARVELSALAATYERLARYVEVLYASQASSRALGHRPLGDPRAYHALTGPSAAGEMQVSEGSDPN